MLSPEELERYARHIVLREVGGPGQTALKEASVLVIGAGGLGAPVLMYLAAAGVGTLGVVDDDMVSLSNLQRQIIHTTPDIGKRKVDSAAQQIHALNPHVNFEAHAVRLKSDNVMSLIGGYDLVLDGSDNFETRYLVSDACFLAAKPLITAALGQFDGSLTTIRAHEHGADGQFNPTYRCLFPEAPPPGTVPACAIALAVSSGFCKAGRIGMVVTGLGLVPAVDGGVNWACADGPRLAKIAAVTINVAESTDLMTNPRELGNTGGNIGAIIEVRAIKHICLVGNNCAPVQGTALFPSS